MKKKIAILGHFGGEHDFLDGQTVKTKILFSELKQNTDWDIQCIDTYYKSKHPIKLFFGTLKALLLRKDIIVLLSGNGMKFFFPILSFFARNWKVRIFHDVIGGNLEQYVDENIKFRRYLNSFVINWVETDVLKTKLAERKVINCQVVPNFKRIDIIDESSIPSNYTEPFKFCTFSRVMKEKGIEEAISAIKEINKATGKIICCLDIYGPIDDKYKEEFEKIKRNMPEFVHYRGTVPFDKSTEIISQYFALLFPTYWKGEGFPGTIVDSFSAGLPVIASDWNSNRELIQNMENGVLYQAQNQDALIEAINCLICMDKNKVVSMKRKCINTARHYQPDRYIANIIAAIGRE